MKTSRDELIDIMQTHNLSIKQVAALLNKQESTVRVWRCESSKNIPDDKLKLLKYMLKISENS